MRNPIEGRFLHGWNIGKRLFESKNHRLLVNKNWALRRENGIYLDVFFPPPKEISVLLFHY